MLDYLQIRLGGDDCTCYDLSEFLGEAFIIEPHNKGETCNSGAITLTYGSSTDKQTLYDGDYLIKWAPNDIVGYPRADYEQLFSNDT